jgi:hypothetical protein
VLRPEVVAVGVHRRADVAALGVQQHQGTGGPGTGDGVLQDGETAGAVPLVERQLRLEDGDRAGQRVDDGVGEPGEPVRVVAQPPPLEQRRVRVDPHAQRAAGGHGVGEALAEGGAHRASRWA